MGYLLSFGVRCSQFMCNEYSHEKSFIGLMGKRRGGDNKIILNKRENSNVAIALYQNRPKIGKRINVVLIK